MDAQFGEGEADAGSAFEDGQNLPADLDDPDLRHPLRQGGADQVAQGIHGKGAAGKAVRAGFAG
ncbi:MAG: hypothetical protein ABSG04_16935 [Verrucomicrobiota bacterium]